MFFGLPWTAWLLIAIAILPSLAIVLRFYSLHHEEGAWTEEAE